MKIEGGESSPLFQEKRGFVVLYGRVESRTYCTSTFALISSALQVRNPKAGRIGTFPILNWCSSEYHVVCSTSLAVINFALTIIFRP
jgi:hypothetical protein